MHIPLFAQLQDNTDAARQLLQQTAAAANVEPVIETISVWELIQNGGWYIIGPLGAMSVLAIYIII